MVQRKSKVWRKAHPKAKFVEIEAEMEARIKGLREQVLAEVLEMSEASAAEGQVLRCPACGAEMEGAGRTSEGCKGRAAARWSWSASTWNARPAARVFSPLDEALGLLPGSLLPYQQECLVRLCSWMPFGKAAQMLQDLLGVSCSKATARRISQAAGAAYVAIQTEAADQMVGQSPPPAQAGVEKALLSVDGAIIPLVSPGLNGTGRCSCKPAR